LVILIYYVSSSVKITPSFRVEGTAPLRVSPSAWGALSRGVPHPRWRTLRRTRRTWRRSRYAPLAFARLRPRRQATPSLRVFIPPPPPTVSQSKNPGFRGFFAFVGGKFSLHQPDAIITDASAEEFSKKVAELIAVLKEGGEKAELLRNMLATDT
jgi:hypothetical protein